MNLTRKLVIFRAASVVTQAVGICLFLSFDMYFTAAWSMVCGVWTMVDLLSACSGYIEKPEEEDGKRYLPLTGRRLNRVYFSLWFFIAIVILTAAGGRERFSEWDAFFKLLGIMLATTLWLNLERLESLILLEKRS